MLALMLALNLLQDAPPALPAPQKIGCRLSLSIDMSLQDRWFHSPGELGVDLPEAKSVARGQTLAAYVFFQHWTQNGHGDIGVDYDIRIKRPNGGLYRADEKLEGHSGPPGDEQILMADQFSRIVFDPADALGEYVVTVTVRDRASGTQATAQQSVQLVDYAEGPGFDTQAAFDSWFREYFRKPAPERAIPALLDMGRLGLWKDPATAVSAVAFLEEVFASNDWLVPFLLKRFDAQDADTRRMILRTVVQSRGVAKTFVDGLKGPDADAWKKLSAETPRDPLIDPISQPGHVDELWGLFYASGRFAPVLRLCQALVSEQTEVISEDADRKALTTLIATSIRDQARQHTLVRNYLDGIVGDETIPDVVRDGLEKIWRSK